MTYETTLIQTGLTKDQASVYEVLLKHGTMPASRIPRLVPISRPLAYKILQELITLGLVRKHEEKGTVATFVPEHPLKLKEFIEKKRIEAEDAKVALDGVLGKLLSDFNLTSGKPGVQFFEGTEGMRAVLDDALDARTDILAYVDIDIITRELADISKAFGASRVRRKIKKRNIAIDTPENRKLVDAGYLDAYTEERLIPWSTTAFGASMQIYDDKISYLTFGAQKIGVIITDPLVTQMQRTLFEFTWNNPLAYIPAHQVSARNTGEGRSNTA